MTQQRTTENPRATGRTEGELLLVDKPRGWTSFDVVHFTRKLLRVRKAGHAGTLDPMATGLLIICTEARTREMEQFIGMDKEYEVEMMLGARTESYDAETPIIERRDIADLTPDRVRETLRSFVGPQAQVPPMWSAVKVRGKPLYRYARKGQVVERAPRQVVVHALEERDISLPAVRFRLRCSKGTYVRSLVNSVGEHLGCGAYVSALRRTRIGPYNVADALTVEQLSERTVEKIAGHP